MEVLGVCLGASTLSMVRLRRVKDTIEIVSASTVTHEGNPRKTLLEALEQAPQVRDIPIAVTGRKFINFIELTTISEPEAVESAAAHILRDREKYRVVVSAGEKLFWFITWMKTAKSKGFRRETNAPPGPENFFSSKSAG